MASPSRFLALPPELREPIYRAILSPDANRIQLPDEYTKYDYRAALVLFQLNRQIYLEARKVFRACNTFVCIETPWPEAENHVALMGHVPMLAAGARASRFHGHSLTVTIYPPEIPIEQNEDGEPQVSRFLILLDDLEKFTAMWFYSSLTNPGLNPQLRLTLALRDPYASSDDTPFVPEKLQRRLLLPFGMVKSLHSVVLKGTPAPSSTLGDELRVVQACPPASPEACLREALRLKALGNTALTVGDCTTALEHYKAAWLAIHVVVHGRKRHIHSDAFFARELREPPFSGKMGQSERLILRVQLVANTCLAYLKLKAYEECVFWGMRSINMLREAMGANERQEIPPEQEAVRSFPAADSMGKVYYRTALAVKEMGERGEARKLLRVASIYLPRDEKIRQEMASVALQLG